MTSRSVHGECRLQYRSAAIVAVVVLNVMGAIYYAHFLNENGYLPSPFLFDKSDTFMDFFNPMYWAYDAGRYTEWKSAYPPLNFLIMQFVNFLLGGAEQDEPHIMRGESGLVIGGFCAIGLLLPALLQTTRQWRAFSATERVQLYVALILSSPMLFALERGNLIVLCPIFLAIALSRIGVARALCIALLINLKPYFGLLLFYYVARRNWEGLVLCTVLSGSIFAITGLILDDSFLLLLSNLLSFSQVDGLFSMREVMSFPSSVSAISYVLKTASGAEFAASILSRSVVEVAALLIEATKWGIIFVALVALATRARRMRDAEIFALLVVLISNFGIWVGGYTLITYAALLPVFLTMRGRPLYFFAMALIALPLDAIPLRGEFIGVQYSYLSDSSMDVYWTLGLGSLLRPAVNLALLLILSLEFLRRKAGATSAGTGTDTWARIRSSVVPRSCSNPFTHFRNELTSF